MGTEVMGGGVVDVFFGAVDAVPPEIDATKATILSGAVWSEIGEGFIDEDGFNVDLANTINKVFVLRSTAPQRVYRTQEEPMFEFNLFESTMDAMSIALQTAELPTAGVVAGASGTAGYKRLQIKRGAIIQEAAILFRTVSPYDTAPATNGWLLQGWLPRGVFTQVGSFKFYKEQVALPLTFELLESTTNDLGYIEAQHEMAQP